MTADQILVHKLELAITGRTSIPMGQFRSDRYRDKVCADVGGNTWWYDQKEQACIIAIIPEAPDPAVKLWSRRLFQQTMRNWSIAKLSNPK